MTGLRKSTGNMYPWVTHMHAALGGKCQHKCSYCYVDSPKRGIDNRFTGPTRLLEEEMNTNFGSKRTIFIEHLNDLFSYSVPDHIIERVLEHCRKYPDNIYIFQTKNPERYWKIPNHLWPPRFVLGATIETNRDIPGIGFAPSPTIRYMAMRQIIVPKFITIEPIMDFDLDIFVEQLQIIKPDFVNIGADSKGHNLPEPSSEKVKCLIQELEKSKIEIREKHNLDRILNG